MKLLAWVVVFIGIGLLILAGVMALNVIEINELQNRQDYLEEHACIRNMIDLTGRVECLEHEVDSLKILLNEVLK